MPQHTSYSEVIRFRAPDGFGEAIAEAAARDITTTSEFVRRALVERLRSLGIDPTKMNGRDNSRHEDITAYISVA
ncbi:hypothetical protein [Microvirga sesbaniae]|uniref:hypothetical protein n=1 Tax=Microvirga sesbaniae TaxID=681392 RepID=UPI0021C8EA6A|nr:hypothetical protein [Microvirga sp. HBU67692]